MQSGSEYSKLTVYIPVTLLKRVQIASAQAGEMRYSGFAAGLLSKGFTATKPYNDYKDLATNSRLIPDGFANSGRGNPHSDRDLLKKKVTFYFTPATIKLIKRNCRKFNLSISSAVELGLEIGSTR